MQCMEPVCSALLSSGADSEEFNRLVSGAQFIMVLTWRAWSNDWLSHWSWELEMWMMDWATPAAACEKSDFVQMSCSRQPLPRLLHHPVFQAVCFSRENPCLLLGFLPPSLPFHLSSFQPSAFSSSSFSPFSQLSPSPVSFSSSGLFLWVLFCLAGTWQEEGPQKH